MRDGRYQVTFTTTNGVLGEGVVLFKGDNYVGADFIHSYYGRATQVGDELKVSMHCRRHGADFVSTMDLPLEFDVEWTGTENARGFLLETRLPGSETVLSATGRWASSDESGL